MKFRLSALVLITILTISSLKAQNEVDTTKWENKTTGYSLLFKFGSKHPQAEDVKMIQSDIQSMLAESDTTPETKLYHINIEGYTDPVGRASYNKRLSAVRAKNVANALVEPGIPDSIMNVIGFGEEKADEMIKAGLTDKEMRRVDLAIHYLVAKKLIPTTSIRDLYALLGSMPQTFTLTPYKDTLITCDYGTVIHIPDSGFLNLNGNSPIELTVYEAIRPQEMISYNHNTVSKGRPVATGGMLKVSASQNGTRLDIDKLELPSFFVPSDNYLAKGLLYEGGYDSDSTVKWINPTSISLNRMPYNSLAMCSELLCDGPEDCSFFWCKINRFFGIEKRPEDAFTQQLEDSKQDREDICTEVARLMLYYGVEDVAELVKALEDPMYEVNGVSNHDSLTNVIRTRLAEEIKARYLGEEKSIDDMQYYAFQKGEWGWSGVHQSIDIPRDERADLTIDMIVAKDRDVKIYLPASNTMITADNSGDRYKFRGLPKGQEAIVIALEYRNGKASLGHRRLIIAESTIPMNLNHYPVEELQQALDSIDFSAKN